jgi:hypothetical protein
MQVCEPAHGCSAATPRARPTRRQRGKLPTWRTSTALLLLALGASAATGDQPKPAAPALDFEHIHPSGAFTFRTPRSWRVTALPEQPYAIQASHETLLVRFLYRRGEAGFDSLHVTCMLERLADPMKTHPTVRYEYDFLSGVHGVHEDRRFLDSAFLVTYDEEVLGHREWRQRNITVVGAGESLCAISYAPAKIWKKDEATQALLDAIFASVTFRPHP